ncbi:hypothetical protein KHA80_22950 [Anaerobacillus sp. HL2]|nr:hypothetical protein KHA80_22950 [Anaerobacillus sp. HL2]
MNNRWTNVDPYLKELSTILPTIHLEESINHFFEKSVPTLISMLRGSTKTNGTFIILNEQLENKTSI